MELNTGHISSAHRSHFPMGISHMVHMVIALRYLVFASSEVLTVFKYFLLSTYKWLESALHSSHLRASPFFTALGHASVSKRETSFVPI